MADTCISAEQPPAPSPRGMHGEPLPPSRRPYGPGDLLGKQYRLESLLGRGGMGEVWTARNETLNVLRAVKLIRADVGALDNTDRLLREARAAAALADPAIVRVFDFGQTDAGEPYIVMELLEGEDLISIIDRRERLSGVKAVRLLLPVIRALAIAHAHGIVHRDLKPENIFLARLAGGRIQPKLLDFGIAKLESARSLRLTTAGEVMGSPLYMAPEQARGEEVDARADIWALCVVLYEAMAGDTPFTGTDRSEVFRAVNLSDPHSLVDAGVADEALWQIVRRGLSKTREERFQTMAELGQALARWLLDQGVRDDIAGASLEAAWFRSSSQSLFSSSLPPVREPPRADSSRLDGWLRRARATHAGRWLATLPRAGRYAVFGALVVLLGTGIAFVADSGQEPLRRGAREPRPKPTSTPTAEHARRPALAPTQAAMPPAPNAEAPEAPAAGANDDHASTGPEPTSAAPPARRAVGVAKGAKAPQKPRRREQARRRSRLIDPY